MTEEEVIREFEEEWEAAHPWLTVTLEGRKKQEVARFWYLVAWRRYGQKED